MEFSQEGQISKIKTLKQEWQVKVVLKIINYFNKIFIILINSQPI